LGDALNSTESFKRSTAVFVLDMQSEEARAAMPRLLEMVSGDPEPMVRLAVVEALRRFGADASGAVPALAAALRRVREQGYALVDEELEMGLRSLAVPVVTRTGRLVAAMNTGVHTSRATLEEMAARFLPALRNGALALGRALG